ncbi:histidine phosphatase family protein [Schaalia vaccimaxillae]|uniref:histidine phosphatase family protein n=1 Tax=Schaalia vaccimaxillae TaxID=183916 RepID=UPI0003B52CF1|nr:histidine phosphatase family protein [Schaalia vaccimaxillae]
MEIVLVRHGQTPANRVRALDTSRPGLPLSEEGLIQADRLAARWELEVAAPPTVVAVSPLTRTRQTAAPLCRKYAIEPLLRSGLRELRSGDIEMNDDVVSDMAYIEGTGAWARGRHSLRMGGGETGREALARVLPVILEVASRVRQEGGERGVGVCVAHGAMLRLLAPTLAQNVDGELVMNHFMGNTGTVVLVWPAHFQPTSVSQLVGALTARTWNDRPIDEWSIPNQSAF